MTDTKQSKLQTLATLIGGITGRFNLFSKMGEQYGGDRNLYQALGYREVLNYNDYWSQYKRQDIAKAIINRPVALTWKGQLSLIESSDDNQTPLEQAWEELVEALKLKNKFVRVDKLTCLGKYGVLLLGLDDVKQREDFVKPVEGTTRKLLYVRPLGEENAKIGTWEKDAANPRYGLPLYYDITLKNPGSGESYTLKVHHTRIIHTTYELLEDETEGVPVLEAVFNRLQDLEKLIGGSAEMFWRGARPGYSGEVQPDFKMSDQMWDDLKTQIEEYEHNLRRILVAEGVNMKELAMQIADPKNHVDVQMQMISAVTGIPKRMLTGSERGELSSTQDQDEWRDYIQTRREEYAEASIVRPFIETMIKYGVLPHASAEGYSVGWSDLFARGEKELAEVGQIRAAALKDYVSQPVAEEVVPSEAFFEFFLGLSQDQIDLIKEMREAMVNEESQVIHIPEEEPEETEDEETKPIIPEENE
jgi:uncharacterized protein